MNTEKQNEVSDTYCIKLNGMLATIPELDFSSEQFDVDFNGNYLVQVSKTKNGFEVTNAMNGWGVNCKEEFENVTVSVYKLLQKKEPLRDEVLYNKFKELMAVVTFGALPSALASECVEIAQQYAQSQQNNSEEAMQQLREDYIIMKYKFSESAKDCARLLEKLESAEKLFCWIYNMNNVPSIKENEEMQLAMAEIKNYLTNK